MKATCPKCGAIFDLPRKIGGGTKRRLANLSLNQQEICKVLIDFSKVGQCPSVAQIRRELVDRKIKRWSMWDYKHRFASGYWENHHVQINLSLLVGNKLVTMVGRGYWMTKEQIKAYTDFPKKSPPPPPKDVLT